MGSLSKLFLDFHDENSLTKTYKEKITKGRDALRNKIGNKFEEKGRKKPQHCTQGSYAMKTAIMPLDGDEFDLDNGVYLRGYSTDQDDWPAAQTVHTWVKEAVEKHTSNSPIDKNTCIRVVYEDKYHIDLPIYIMGENSAGELVRDTGIEDYVTVGEMSSTTLEHCIRYSGAEEKELSMCFNFHHLKVDYKDGNKWELMEPDYMELKVIFEKWQMGMQRGNAWNALFWCNHDQPRIVSRFGNEGEYWKESAKMLAGMIHLMRGTPYIYQGEEIGMTNPHYTSIEQYADVESRNYYEILLNEGKTKEEALEILAARSRDNSRTPMQWTDERYCGFSDTKPWIPVSDNFEKINVKKQKQDRDSILEFYKKLIMLRKEKEVIARGNIEFMEVENAGVLAYTRCLDKQKLLVCCNFRDVESQMEFTQEWKSGRKILGNYEENHKNNYKVLTLRPYEIIVLEKGEE